jgi:hypothetical protein
MDKPKLTFTLVHGTFATADANWIADDEDPAMFRRRLRQELDDHEVTPFRAFDWGAGGFFRRLMDNTNARRRYGVRKLKEYLRACPDVDALNRHYIVAHSHGGNVVMRALRDPELADKVTGVICLSTPFLTYRRAAFNRALLFFSAVFLVILATAMQGIAVWIYAAVYVAVTATMLITGTWPGSEEADARIDERLEELQLAGKERFSGEPGRPAFLAIRPHRDEVTILFWVTRGLGKLLRWLWELINRVGARLVIALFLFGIIESVIEELPFVIDIGWLQSLMSGLDRLIVSPLLFVATIVLSALVAMRWSYAFDAVPWITSLGVEPDILPWEGAPKVVMPTLGWMKHTRIQNQSPPAIAEWIRNGHSAS